MKKTLGLLIAIILVALPVINAATSTTSVEFTSGTAISFDKADFNFSILIIKIIAIMVIVAVIYYLYAVSKKRGKKKKNKR